MLQFCKGQEIRESISRISVNHCICMRTILSSMTHVFDEYASPNESVITNHLIMQLRNRQCNWRKLLLVTFISLGDLLLIVCLWWLMIYSWLSSLRIIMKTMKHANNIIHVAKLYWIYKWKNTIIQLWIFYWLSAYIVEWEQTLRLRASLQCFLRDHRGPYTLNKQLLNRASNAYINDIIEHLRSEMYRSRQIIFDYSYL